MPVEFLRLGLSLPEYWRFGQRKKRFVLESEGRHLGQAPTDRHDLNDMSMRSVHCAMGKGAHDLVGEFSLLPPTSWGAPH